MFVSNWPTRLSTERSGTGGARGAARYQRGFRLSIGRIVCELWAGGRSLDALSAPLHLRPRAFAPPNIYVATSGRDSLFPGDVHGSARCLPIDVQRAAGASLIERNCE